MFIDYVSLMLINLAAGLALLAGYVYLGLGIAVAIFIRTLPA